MSKRTGTIARDEKGRTAPHVPTPTLRKLVLDMTGIGCTMEEIQHVVPWGRPDGKPISIVTLRKHYSAELKRGRPMADMRLRGKMFEIAQQGNVAMLIFLAKVRLGMKETQIIENVGKDGEPLQVAQLYLPVKSPPPDTATVQQPRPATVDRVGSSHDRAALAPPAPPPRQHAGSSPDESTPAAFGGLVPLNDHVAKRFRI